jgi:hypothetical protein
VGYSKQEIQQAHDIAKKVSGESSGSPYSKKELDYLHKLLERESQKHN